MTETRSFAPGLDPAPAAAVRRLGRVRGRRRREGGLRFVKGRW
jgi:hypothetical protein